MSQFIDVQIAQLVILLLFRIFLVNSEQAKKKKKKANLDIGQLSQSIREILLGRTLFHLYNTKITALAYYLVI